MKHITMWVVVAFTVIPLAAQPRLTIGASARTGLEVTIYQANIGLVKDTRSFTLQQGG